MNNAHLLDELDDRVSQKSGASIAELLESDEARVRAPEHTVTITEDGELVVSSHGTHAEYIVGSPRDNLATLQRPPEEVLDVVMGDVIPKFLLHVHLPTEDLLVGQPIAPSDPTNSEMQEVPYPWSGPARAYNPAAYDR